MTLGSDWSKADGLDGSTALDELDGNPLRPRHADDDWLGPSPPLPDHIVYVVTPPGSDGRWYECHVRMDTRLLPVRYEPGFAVLQGASIADATRHVFALYLERARAERDTWIELYVLGKFPGED